MSQVTRIRLADIQFDNHVGLVKVTDNLKKAPYQKKYLVDEDIDTVFASIDAYVSSVQPENYKIMIEAVGDFLKQIGDQAYACRFASLQRVLDIMDSDERSEVLQACLEFMSLIIVLTYQHSAVKNPFKLNSDLKKNVVLFGLLVANGFRSFGNENFEVTHFTKTREQIVNEYSDVLLESPEKGFEKITFDLKPHTQLIRENLPEFRKLCSEYVEKTYHFMNSVYRSTICHCLVWRGRLLGLCLNPNNSAGAMITLCLEGKLFSNNCKRYAADIISSLEMFVPKPADLPCKAVSTLLSVAHSGNFHAKVLASFNELESSRKDPNTFKLLVELLESYNDDALRRRSSGKFGMDEESLAPVVKDSGLLLEVLKGLHLNISHMLGSKENVGKDSYKVVQIVMSIFEKAVEPKADGTLLLHYHPKCYPRFLSVIKSDSRQIVHTVKDLDGLLSFFTQAKRIEFQETATTVKELTTEERTFMVVGFVEALICFINEGVSDNEQHTELQNMMPDLINFKLWKACLGPDSKEPHEVKLLTHKLIVELFKELQTQFIIQASEKFLADSIIEGLLVFVRNYTDLDLSLYINTLFLLSKIVQNKKIEKYVYESEILQYCLEKLVSKDIFFNTYLKKSKFSIAKKYIAVAESLFETSHVSDLLAETIETAIPKLLRVVSQVQRGLGAWRNSFKATGKPSQMIDEGSDFAKYWHSPNTTNPDYESNLFEEFAQVLMRFFKKFLEVESTNLAVRLIEKKDFLSNLLDLYLCFVSPSYVNMNERNDLLLEAFTTFSSHQNQNVSQVQIAFFNTILFPRFAASVKDLAALVAGAPAELLTKAIQQLHPCFANKFTQPVEARCLEITAKYAECGLLCSLAMSGLQTTERIAIEESSLLEVLDLFIHKIHRNLLLPQSHCVLNNMKVQIGNADKQKITFDSLSTKNDWDVVAKIANTLKEFMRTQFKQNHKIISLVYAALGKIVFEVPAQESILQELHARFEMVNYASLFFADITSQRPNASQKQARNPSAFVAFYEGGLVTALEPLYPELVTLIQESLHYLNHQSSGKVAEVQLAAVLLMHLHKLPAYTFYTAHQTQLELDKFFRGGVEQPKSQAAGKCRFVIFKLYENLKNLVFGVLKWSAEVYEGSEEVLKRVGSQLCTSEISKLAIPADSLKRLEKAYTTSFEALLKSAISFSVKDVIAERGPGDRTGPFHRQEQRRIPQSVIGKLMEFGFDEEKIRFASNHVRNPSDLNEMIEWMLANSDKLENIKRPQEDPREEIVPESPLMPHLVDCPAKEQSEFKQDMIEQYKRYCQTLIKYFLFIPFYVDFVGVLQNYTNHVHENMTGAKSSRQFLFDLYYLFVDFLILLKSQLTGFQANQKFEDFQVKIPNKFHKVKTVNPPHPDWRNQDSRRAPAEAVQPLQLGRRAPDAAAGRHLHDHPRTHRDPEARGRELLDAQLRPGAQADLRALLRDDIVRTPRLCGEPAARAGLPGREICRVLQAAAELPKGALEGVRVHRAEHEAEPSAAA